MNYLLFLLTGEGCPAAPIKEECPDPVAECSFDYDCPANKKCCDDGCAGRACRGPGKVSLSCCCDVANRKRTFGFMCIYGQLVMV